MSVSPLVIEMALAFYSRPDPSQAFTRETWSSDAGMEAREWMFHSGLVDGDGYGTKKLEVWVKAICSVPLPVHEWRIPWEAAE